MLMQAKDFWETVVVEMLLYIFKGRWWRCSIVSYANNPLGGPDSEIVVEEFLQHGLNRLSDFPLVPATG